MKKTINIKNFRVFDENGATFELNPITILTGSNSSGKSSVNKALMLLKTYIDKIREDIQNGRKTNLSAYKLDFAATANTLKLGSFHQVLHYGSENELITFEITTYSRLLGEDVVVTLAFGPDKNDTMDNGYLRLIEFKKTDGTILYNCDCPQNSSTAQLDCLKNRFFKFLNTIINWNLAWYQFNEVTPFEYENDYRNFAETWGYAKDENDISYKSIFREKRKKYVDIVRDYDNTYKINLKDICFPNSKEPDIELSCGNPFYEEIKRRLQGEMSLIENTFKLGTLFYMPILEDVWVMDKTKVRSYLAPIVDDKNNLQDAFDAIMDDFEESDYNFFGEYFKEKECEYINRFYSGKKYSIFLSSEDDPYDLYSPHFEDSWLSDSELYEFATEAHKAKGIDIKERFSCLDKKDVIKRLRKPNFNIIWILRILNNTNKPAAKIVQMYKCYGLFQKYIECTFNDLIATIIAGGDSNYHAIINSSAIKRLYTMESIDEFTSILLEYVECRRKFDNLLDISRVGFDDYNETRIKIEESHFEPGYFINKWLKVMDIADEIVITNVVNGLGLTISTRKANENKTLLLADQGVGITQIVALLLSIESIIMKSFFNHNDYWLSEDRKYKIHYNNQLLILEEPEIHLHPKYQSLLADIFLEAYGKYKIHFIIETHAE